MSGVPSSGCCAVPEQSSFLVRRSRGEVSVLDTPEPQDLEFKETLRGCISVATWGRAGAWGERRPPAKLRSRGVAPGCYVGASGRRAADRGKKVNGQRMCEPLLWLRGGLVAEVREPWRRHGGGGSRPVSLTDLRQRALQRENGKRRLAVDGFICTLCRKSRRSSMT